MGLVSGSSFSVSGGAPRVPRRNIHLIQGGGRLCGDVDESRGFLVAVAVRSKAALERCACAVWLCVCTWGAAAALSAASLASAAFVGGSIVAASATASAAAVAAVCGGARGSARCACMRCVHMCARYNTVSVDRCPMWTRLLSVSSA